MSKVTGLPAILKKFLNTSNEIKSIIISTNEGNELISESKVKFSNDEVNVVLSLVPAFVQSIQQSVRLGIGSSKYTLSWTACGVILQSKIGNLVVSILMSENANIGLIEENLNLLENILRPFCETYLDS